jgi:hypothetical protein
VRTRVVTDAWGVRWKVRARQLRGGGTPPPRPGPEEESLRRRLAGAMARHPAPAPAPGSAGWMLPGDTADVEMYATLAELRRDPMTTPTNVWAVVQFVRLVRDAVEHLRTPMSDRWQVEVIARGRIRRWARWEITGADAAEQAVVTVASGVSDGRVPEPWGATLVDVVDQRPPYRLRPVA